MTVVDVLSGILPAAALDTESSVAGAAAVPAPGRPPEAVVRPGTTGEVATLLEWAAREDRGVLPMASGRRLRPVRGGGAYVALATDRLSGIEQYEAADLTLTAGAGTPLSTVADALAENGQWAPFDPAHVDGRSLGGLVATGDSGPLWMGYGALRHHVLGMTVVSGDGRTLDLGGRVVKNVAGYDVLKAVVGSRGTLAVVTSVCLRAFPLPPVDRLLVHTGTSVNQLLDAALAVGTAPVLPVSCVVVDRLEAVGGRAALLVRLHGAEATVDADRKSLEAHVGVSFDEVGALDTTVIRDHAADGAATVTASCLPSRLPDLLAALEALQPRAMLVDSYGSLVRVDASATPAEAIAEVRRAVEGLGGALRTFAPGTDHDAVGDTPPSAGEVELIRRLREAFDPQEVLWPARR